RKNWPRDHALVEAALAYAVGMLGAGNNGAAVVTLNSIPRNLLDKFEPSEIDYWRARALESSNPPAAFAAYLNVLRSPMPTHFAYLARQRLDSRAMAPKLAQELAMRDGQVAALIKSGSFDLARRVQTDRILLSSSNHADELKRLAGIYRQLPPYRAVLELKPHEFPRFPLVANPDRLSLLLAMGLFDEATDEIQERYPLRPMSSALTRSLALNRGNASRDSIYAVEVLMRSVPNDYLPELLPLVVRRLLYPRFFYDYIVEDSKHFDADPTLVLAIMREESRFNPRAKSEAAARGLLQFIITTASEIGRDIGLVDVTPEDLYDPRVIIRLGARYVTTLSKQFSNDHYETAAAYNAGPHQVALWARLSPGAGDDFFLSAINFDETKQYVRKVMNSYKRYAEIYGNAGPQGGIRIEP
ncbi:MAG TPA: lytic transglycosylase domain-containing protein, partial [Thermoanaerobaculia bacterium]